MTTEYNNCGFMDNSKELPTSPTIATVTTAVRFSKAFKITQHFEKVFTRII